MANRYGDAPYAKTPIPDDTWTQVAFDNFKRRRLVLHTRVAVGTAFFFALQRDEPTASITDTAQEMPAGATVSFDATDQPTSAVWVYQNSGVAKDFFVSEVTE